MTLTGVCRDDEVALTMGFVNYVPSATVDPMGRALFFFQPARQDRTAYTRESMTRAVWYMIHAALVEQPEAQKHGLIFLIHPRGAQLSQFDRGLMKMMLSSIQGILPGRLSAFHICQPPAFIKIILPIAKLFMNDITKKRLRVHFGPNQEICDKLTSLGMTLESIPESLGGKAHVDTKAWIERRRAEGK